MTNHFLQSQEWEEFQRSLGREVFRIQDMLVIKLPLVFGKSYLYIAGFSNFQFFPLRGISRRETIFNFQSIFNSQNFQTLAKQHNAIFLKYEPLAESEKSESFLQELLKAGFKESQKEIQPQKTIILDITVLEEQILSRMHSKTRYNIRVAERYGVKFSIFNSQFSNNSQNSNFQRLEKAWALLQKTAERDGFSTHTREYYEKLLALPNVKLFKAEYQDKIIAANIVLFHGDTAYYLHGASDYEYRKLMAPYLLHWETIKYAKENGYKKYDFWGINKKKWPGVTRFKMGFGGEEIEHVGSFDYVFSDVWYLAYKARQFLLGELGIR